ncbi:lipopolysaccharide/colanic/teichoic acid biosynthesis glycosyltransferase [Paenibacillus castaneae]|uniref:sugar transferase n=1 Tax=Paenibacillus castaneae TaxID=474957 RepID=UPI000C9BD547|nr:sugar transferase [Paenibacillus castaneae]NIK79541.1 lipopolysaccharide/colanic/teichoic acid biosynthesis glycosyltransferase [Paenibacillus castaneae]
MRQTEYGDEAVLNYSHGLAQQANSRSLTVYSVVKRTIDIVGSLAGLVLLSPLLAIIAILIKWEDPKGSVFFYQTRIGKDEKPFRMFKLRSMLTGAEDKLKDLLDKNEISGAMFKMKDDPRVTKVGKFIRKTSIDELPQLLNVLRGEMSLVGPRPPLTREVAEYTEYDKKRLSVTPGCTGLWQVSGRNHLSFKEMVELDITYIEKRCIWFDIKIILRTFKAIAGSKDAF